MNGVRKKTNKTILAIKNLNIQIGGKFDVVTDLSFSMKKGETVCLVGESGCGKSISAFSILGLLPKIASVTSGRILLNSIDLLSLNERHLREIRGKSISMIFQEPMSSLNPLKTIGSQISEILVRHLDKTKMEAWQRAVELLDIVRLPDASTRACDFPHQLSGGMRQRVMIAMAIACNPQILLADEPTTALDVTIQAQILDLMSNLQEKFGTTILLISHDMGLVAENADRVIVMYAGRKVEEAPVKDFFARPSHPYSRGLLNSLPQLGKGGVSKKKKLSVIPGTIPSPDELPSGCPFATRCSFADERCWKKFPNYQFLSKDHLVACWYPVTAE